TALRDAQSAVIGYLFIGADMTARKLAEEARKTSDDFLERTGRIAGVGGWEFDLRTEAVTWGAQTCRIQDVEPGYTPSVDEALAFFPPGARPIRGPESVVALEQPNGWDEELALVTAKGRAI